MPQWRILIMQGIRFSKTSQGLEEKDLFGRWRQQWCGVYLLLLDFAADKFMQGRSAPATGAGSEQSPADDSQTCHPVRDPHSVQSGGQQQDWGIPGRLPGPTLGREHTGMRTRLSKATNSASWTAKQWWFFLGDAAWLRVQCPLHHPSAHNLVFLVVALCEPLSSTREIEKSHLVSPLGSWGGAGS